MTILREYGINGDKRLRYNLTQAAGARMSDMVGQRLQIKAYVLYEDTDSTGEIKKGLTVLTTDGEYVGTRSQCFIRGFEQFLTCMESDECTEMEIAKVRSQSGRDYLRFLA